MVQSVWRVVYIAPSRGLAEMIQGVLCRDGFLVTVRPAGTEGEHGPAFEVLVPQSEVEEAHDAISQLLLSRSVDPGTGPGVGPAG